MKEANELIDLVDDNDIVIGTIARVDALRRELSMIRVVHGFIKNSHERLWIARRTMEKTVAPGGLDASVGGHVRSGESYEQAFIRETAEELNIDLTVVPYAEVGSGNRETDGLYCYEKIFEIYSDEVPRFNRQDISEGFWLTPAGITEKIAAGEPYLSDLPVLISLFYS